MMRLVQKLGFFAALAGVLSAGCGSDERFSGSASGGEGGSAAGSGGAGGSGATSGSGGSAGGAPVKRSVATRNPYGNVAEHDNLLWDGDFEWHTAFASQYGWVTPSFLDRFQPTTLDEINVGPDCRSGLKCAPMPRNSSILGVGVAPTDAQVAASIWAKPASGSCAEVQVVMTGCFSAADADVVLTPAGAPDDRGWCEYSTVAPARQRATCLLVSTLHTDQTTTLVDDAVLKAAPANARLVGTRAEVPSELAARLPAMRRGMQKWLSPGDRPPSKKQLKLKAWLERRGTGRAGGAL